MNDLRAKNIKVSNFWTSFKDVLNRRLWLSVPFFALAVIILSLLPEGPIFEPPFLLFGLNFIFSTFICLIIAFLAGRSFLKSGEISLLFFGSGLLCFGIASMAGGIMISLDKLNTGITAQNSGALFAGIFHLLSAAVIWRNDMETSNNKILPLSLFYILAVFILSIITLSALTGLTPEFFVQGSGPTLIRQTILSGAIITFVLSSILMADSNKKDSSHFFRFYSMGLALISVGLLGYLLLNNVGSALSWTGRISQYLGGICLLTAILPLARENKDGELSLHKTLLKMQKALEKSESRHKELFDSIDSGFCIIKLKYENSKAVDFTFIEVNPAFKKHTGFKDAMGKSIKELNPDLEDHWLEIYGEVGLTGKPKQFVAKTKSINRWYDVYAFRTGEPEEYRVAILFEDITERKENEERIRQLNDQLEKRVEERTSELENRANELQQLALKLSDTEEREQQRIAEILHDDLQQYLVAIRFHLQLVKPKNPSEKIVKKMKFLEELIDDSVQKCRTLSHELSPAVLHQNGFIAALEWLARDMEKKQGLKVELKKTEEAEPDTKSLATLLYRSVRELLFNCVKHSKADKVFVEAVCENNIIKVTVSDEGEGFDPKKAKQRDTEEKGFGLFNIEERIKYLGGNLDIKSAPGKGTSIAIKITKSTDQKISEDVAEKIPIESYKKDESGKVKKVNATQILLTDDHELVREGLCNLIEGEKDLEVTAQATNGYEAVKLAKELKPDVVVMDISLPGMNGIKATEVIKKELPDIHVIGLSMDDDPETRKKMLYAGASEYLHKAESSGQLVETIRKIKGEKSLITGEESS